MKNLFYIIAFFSFAISSFAQTKYTADYYKADPDKYLDTIVTVKIDSASPSSFTSAKGYVAYHCWTSYNGERGGYIYVLVPTKKSKAFFRDYHDVRSNISVDGYKQKSTRDLRATFSKIKWEGGAEEYCLIVGS